MKVSMAAFLIVLMVAGVTYGQDKLRVFTGILPQKFFVEQIGKGAVDVDVMVQPGASPHTYEPRPQQMVAISRAKLYFAIGVQFENVWLKRIASSNPSMKIIKTHEGIERVPMMGHDHEEEGGHQGHSHEGSAPDPHIWLSPPLVLIQARNILSALQEADPSNFDLYEANYRDLVSRVISIDSELRNIFKDKKGISFMVFHPAWGYFARAYGLSQIPVEIEGKEPKPSQLQRLIQDAKARNVKVIFTQPQFSTRSAEQVAREIGGQVITVDPLALDWVENMREVAEKFKAGLR
ncbi:MAG: cation ABC transporter substrate-binding protein [Desulfobacteraceae bacterium]|nr:MAG: cation ABC transporter substrate-binding protein [Desulfobacteraceae bacterium]